MKRQGFTRISPRALVAFLLISIGVAGGFGCQRTGTAPAPLALEEIPGEMQRVFSSANGTDKDLIAKFYADLQSKDYPAAFGTLQSITALHGLTGEQHSILARAMLTLTSVLQTAQSQGDQKSDTALKQYYMNK